MKESLFEGYVGRELGRNSLVKTKNHPNKFARMVYIKLSANYILRNPILF